MIKETITYVDFEGNTVTEDAYFHMSKLELLEMNISDDVSMRDKLLELIKEQKGTEIYQITKELILNAYGKKTEDGKGFIKFDENGKRFSETFKYSEAFSELFTSFISDDVKFFEFIKGVFPSSISNDLTMDKVKTDLNDLLTPEEIENNPILGELVNNTTEEVSVTPALGEVSNDQNESNNTQETDPLNNVNDTNVN